MALFEFRLPDIGEGVAEGEVVSWHVEPGQVVTEDQEMVEVMTDKATVTIGAPKAGRIAQLNAQVGEKVPVGSVLVVIDTDVGAVSQSKPSKAHDNDSAISRFQAPAHRPAEAERHSMRAIEDAGTRGKSDEGPAATAVGDIRESLPGSAFFATPMQSKPSMTGQNGHGGHARAASPFESAETVETAASTPAFYAEKPLATPATRKLARDSGIDLRRVPPTGPGGRVTQQDVQAFVGGASSTQTSKSGAQPMQAKAGPTGQVGTSTQLEERKPFVGLRRKIAERMRMATQTAAHFTFVEEVEVDALKTTIDRLRPAAEKLGVKLNYLPFIVKAVTLALKKHPILNSMLDEAKNELVYKRYYHVGIATATEQGLMVPVLRDADSLSPLSIAREIQRISDGARAGTLSAKELGGSTFTITSLGKQGGLLATPVLNHPEVGILGVHRVKEKPVVRNGQIVVGQVMLLSLSFDHRIIDGHIGAAFAYDVIAYLENPDLLLLELA
jgi:pyruvate dehydrogenase E2 component (dihydrolipoamide acetyltransferase)